MNLFFRWEPAMEPMVYSESVARAKTAIRETITRKREALGDVERNEKSLSIAQRLFDLDAFKESKSVFIFLSLPDEVQTEAVIEESFRLGKEVFVPLINVRGGCLQVARIPSLDIKFVVGKHGIREPAPEVREIVSPSRIDLVVAPGLAFDVRGNRIGYGGGYYDKLLKEISRDSIRVGIGYDFQLLGLVPHSDFDEPVQFVVTETQLLRCRNV
ncbi:MAG TPA: 5-formyltetrahydrofolate cyclo-ligase [Nitrospinaceae bacterium]|nr:5-formyltetrahydrofolate cyclo-ligase [Nitrospinaceae bacterium]